MRWLAGRAGELYLETVARRWWGRRREAVLDGGVLDELVLAALRLVERLHGAALALRVAVFEVIRKCNLHAESGSCAPRARITSSMISYIHEHVMQWLLLHCATESVTNSVCAIDPRSGNNTVSLLTLSVTMPPRTSPSSVVRARSADARSANCAKPMFLPKYKQR